MKEKFDSLFASLKLNFCCYLSKKKLSDCLHHSVPLDCLNLRRTSSVSESTQYLRTQSGDLERFNCNDELSSVTPNFDFGILKRNPSPDSNDFFEDLSSEFKINKSLGGFHLAGQAFNGTDRLRLDAHSHDQGVTGNQGYSEG